VNTTSDESVLVIQSNFKIVLSWLGDNLLADS